ncbi:FAD/NAD(P)-binding protein [Acidomonas methanolica]|uniref:FAD/NAD(P)-binding protein n=1 Tax=Acidomonas methanolica TaxID=437 RepID=UPI002119E3B5|nr:FAD/NAD(P)-binding protein [Acidomonas methanolica]MCQ9156671.1 FAD/NAD(P)-binding protein [Acidomonas methanolica]
MIRRRVAIIGGGASGALAAIALARRFDPAELAVIEPREEVGRGLAYSTPEPAHLLNVRAANMSALADVPDDFVAWLARNGHAADPEAFVARRVWGEYAHARFLESGVAHLRTTAASIEAGPDGAAIQLASGDRLLAERVVLAMGHAPPVDVADIGANLRRSGRYVRDVWGDWPHLPGGEEHVVLIGSGLTAVDTLLRLRRHGHRGPVVMVSRHGLLTRSHGAVAPMSRCVVPPETPPAALAYFRAFREAVRRGVPWRAAIDSVRGSSNLLWDRLDLEEKRRFRRHLFHLWNTARHRMAPEVASCVKTELERGTLLVRRGHVAGLAIEAEGVSASVRTIAGVERIRTGYVFNCSGPDTNFLRADVPLARRLIDAGHATTGQMGVAFAMSGNGALLDIRGRRSERFYAIGPLRAGMTFETTAIPEIRQQARELSSALHHEDGPESS